MSDAPYVLEFDRVTVLPDEHLSAGLREVSFALRAGEVGIVQVEEGREHVPFADAAEGLVVPDQGCVTFRGEDWESMSAHRQANRRGLVRRVFHHYGWVSNLSILDNICLAELHHTHRRLGEVIEEANALARRFGLDGIPAARPSRVPALALRKLEWVRALLGRPELVILERPLFGAPRADASLLIAAVAEEARRGAAVLWLTDEPRVCGCRGFESCKRFGMQGEQLLPLAAEGA